jgi:TPR repeat protein
VRETFVPPSNEPSLPERKQPSEVLTAQPKVSQDAQEPPVTDCDTLAAHESDPQRKANGIPFEKINPAVAIPACETAVKQFPDNNRLIFLLGRAYQKNSDFNPAITQYRTAADRGYAPAQTSLCVMYVYGRGIAKDERTAVTWCRRAAEQGFARAQYNLGIMYAKGLGIAKDEGAAVTWYRRAAEQGFAPAQHSLGYRYANGQGIAKDEGAAVTWYRRAAEQRYAPAQYNLGVMYENGWGVTKDYAQAIAWYRKAAEQDEPPAQYESGEGMAQDFRMAAAMAKANLGMMYENGRGVAKDEAQAVGWYRKAAEQGDDRAKKRLLDLQVVKYAKLDSTDIVAQVLNYSSSGHDGEWEDAGQTAAFWYRDPSNKCLYHKIRRAKDSQLSVVKSIDLNEYDPRGVKFGHKFASYGNVTTEVTYDRDVLFLSPGGLDLDRMQRGWTLIYTNFCTGKLRPF